MSAFDNAVKAAVRYAELGFPTIPLQPGAKAPFAGTRGFLDSYLPDERMASELWGASPTPNVGLVLLKGIIALDVDRMEALEELEAQGVHLPKTARQTTPRGCHLLFDCPDPLVQAVNIMPGIDLRVGGKGYLVVAPSVVGGRNYQWVDPPDRVEIAPAPEGLLRLLRSKTRDGQGTARRLDVEHLLGGLHKGERNDQTFRYACRLRAQGLSAKEAKILVAEAIDQAEQPLDDRFTQGQGEAIVDRVYSTYPSGISNGARGDADIVCVTASELLEMDLPPRIPLLDGLINRKNLVMLYAPRGIGKTWVGLGVSHALATGGAFLKWKAPMPAKVLYVDGEMQAGELQSRVRMLDRDDSGLLSNLKFIAADMQVEALPSLMSKEAQALIEGHLEDSSLLVLDSHSTLFGGAENDAEAVQPLLEWLILLRRLDVSVLLLHHSGKSGQQRGSSRREDIQDTIIGLRQPDDYEPTDGARFEWRFEKNRQALDAESLQVRLVPASDGHVTFDWGPLGSALRERVLELAEMGVSDRDIGLQLGLHRSTVWRIRQGGAR